MKKFLFLLFPVMLLAGCVQAPVRDYKAFLQAQPKSILIVPAVNKSLDVDAPDYFLSTIARPLAERGYYVFPVNAVKQVMELDGMGDADMVHAADPTRLGELFGADAILYVQINRWDAKYAVLTTTVTVDFTYRIKDGRSGALLWEDKREMVYQPQNNNSSGNPLADLIAAAVTAAMTKAAPNYMPLTQQANAQAAITMPPGPYAPQKMKDAFAKQTAPKATAAAH